MMLNRLPTLDDLAFEGRNKDYGSYDLRRRYHRTLILSVVIGTIIVLLMIIVPWLYFYFEPIPLIEGDMMYGVEYFNMSAPPDDGSSLAQYMAKAMPPEEQTPVVVDSIIPEDKEPVKNPPEQNKDNDQAKVDSSAGMGSPGSGNSAGDASGLNAAIDVYPRFPGGDEARLYYLRKNTRYPDAALKSEVQGVVMVVFIVEADGSVSNVNVTKKIGGGCDEEATRVTREMPRWEAGKRNGRSVRVMVRMPIVFRMPGHTVKGP